MPPNNSSGDFKVLIKLRPSEITDEKQPAFYLHRPKILAVYSYRGCDNVNNAVHFPYFKEPSVTSYPLDLNEGFDKFIFRQFRKFKLDKLEKYVMESKGNVLHPDEHTPSGSWQTQYNFNRKVILCHRGLLTHIMNIPYCLNESPYVIKFFVTKYCGVFHMQEEGNKTTNNFTQKCTYHQKLAQLCFSGE